MFRVMRRFISAKNPSRSSRLVAIAQAITNHLSAAHPFGNRPRPSRRDLDHRGIPRYDDFTSRRGAGALSPTCPSRQGGLPDNGDVAETNSANVASASPSHAEGFSLAGPAYDDVGHSLGRPEDYPFRVLLTIPEATTIPIFALGIEAQRKEVERKLMCRPSSGLRNRFPVQSVACSQQTTIRIRLDMQARRCQSPTPAGSGRNRTVCFRAASRQSGR